MFYKSLFVAFTWYTVRLSPFKNVMCEGAYQGDGCSFSSALAGLETPTLGWGSGMEVGKAGLECICPFFQFGSYSVAHAMGWEG